MRFRLTKHLIPSGRKKGVLAPVSTKDLCDAVPVRAIAFNSRRLDSITKSHVEVYWALLDIRHAHLVKQ